MKRKINWNAIYFMVIYPAIVLALLVTCIACTSPKIIEQHYHHYYQADTLATQAQADGHHSVSTAMIDSLTRSLFDKYRAEWSSQENEKEVTTETITTTIDSLGRQIRTEQRVTQRNLSRLQQQTEQRLTQEFESRLQQALSEKDSLWQLRFEQMQAHWQQSDSTSNIVTPVAQDSRPWYKRWWDRLKDFLLIAAIIYILIFTRHLWLPLLKR